MKKAYKIIISILLVLLIGVNVYLGYTFFTLKSEKDELTSQKNQIEENINNADNTITDLNNKYNELTSDTNNSNLLQEYKNWQRHLEKLQEVMDY